MAEKKQRFINKTARELRLLWERGNKEALNELIIRGKRVISVLWLRLFLFMKG